MFTWMQSQESITMIKKHKSKTRVDIPKQKDGSKYTLNNLSKQQAAVVIAAVDTIVKFLKNKKNTNHCKQLLWDVEELENHSSSIQSFPLLEI